MNEVVLQIGSIAMSTSSLIWQNFFLPSFLPLSCSPFAINFSLILLPAAEAKGAQLLPQIKS